MARQHFLLKLSRQEEKRLADFQKRPLKRRERLRAQAVWFLSQGRTIPEICKLLMVSERGVWKWLKSYRKEGLEGLLDRPRPPRKSLLSDRQQEQLAQVVRQTPASVGIEGYTWNVGLLTRWVNKRLRVKAGYGSVRRALLRRGLRFGRPKLKITSPDPDYALKKSI